MAHSLFVGMTEMGKTTLARDLGTIYRRQGYKNIVLDPLRDPRWPADFITADSEEFIDVCRASKKCMLFMDEGAQSVGRYDIEMQWAATQSRHWGHSAHFICQGATQIAPVIRDNCSRVFVYHSGARNGKLLAEEFNAPDLEMCVSLLPHEYFCAVRGGKCTFHSTKRRFEDAFTSHVERARSFRDRRLSRGEEETREESQQRNGNSSSSSGDGGNSGDVGSVDGGDGEHGER